jgi:hypothetical protein
VYTFLADDTLELYVNSAAFDKECAARSREIYRGSLSDDIDLDYSDDRFNLQEADSSGLSSVESSPYDVSKLEAYLYYFGIRGARRWGPKLIFRTSKDVFPMPSGSHQEVRRMQLLPVYEHQKFSKDNLWATIRSKVRDLLEVR